MSMTTFAVGARGRILSIQSRSPASPSHILLSRGLRPGTKVNIRRRRGSADDNRKVRTSKTKKRKKTLHARMRCVVDRSFKGRSSKLDDTDLFLRCDGHIQATNHLRRLPPYPFPSPCLNLTIYLTQRVVGSRRRWRCHINDQCHNKGE